ncbi:MAG: SUMF1/EgtB/PvdO family nonheme iron enzyme [Gemmatimonadales bacterium]|nr:SUMF1/EgtB/PvdO family nonheme iron enzyme [Gemmatimonadales bacterium]
MTACKAIAFLCLWGGLLAGSARAVDIETVPVGDPGNAGDPRYPSAGTSSGFGEVGYTYNIGKYEVTAGQYTEFLNKVAATDTYGLYNASMWTDDSGCKIQQSGSSGSYVYSVASDYANRPVNYVSWADAARFANWLHNGRPTGTQGPATTEDGAYYLNGATGNAVLPAVKRESDWKWAITSEDEWYKAAYYKGGSRNAGYFDYPTRSNTAPGRDMADASGNNANYYTDSGAYPIDSPYYTTLGGEFQNSASPYGTFDQGGNVWEWNESELPFRYRGLRGGSFSGFSGDLRVSVRYSLYPSGQVDGANVGFRVCEATDQDSDGDGVYDSIDRCPSTIPGMTVDAHGCPPMIPGDFDRDGDVDGVDVSAFAACGSGPAVPVPAGCASQDLDEDADVDAEDFGILQCCLSGENIPGDGSCGPPPGMVRIPAGEFQMGLSFGEGQSDEVPRHAVHVRAFYMHRYEVTTSHYCDALNWANSHGLIFITDGRVRGVDDQMTYCDTTNSNSYSGLYYAGGVFSIKPGRANHPMVMVSWYGAAAYANWRSAMEGRPLGYKLATRTCNFNSGYRLPTEAEWEKAARGGAAGRRFPWSDQDTIQHARANYRSSTGYAYDDSSTTDFHPVWSGVYPGTSPVGFFNGSLRQKADFNWPGSATSYQTANGANGYGLHDMAGNAWEWCNDWYGSTYYSSSPYSNPRGPISGSYAVLRGGGWNYYADLCRVADRDISSQVGRFYNLGFRLVLNAP